MLFGFDEMNDKEGFLNSGCIDKKASLRELLNWKKRCFDVFLSSKVSHLKIEEYDLRIFAQGTFIKFLQLQRKLLTSNLLKYRKQKTLVYFFSHQLKEGGVK